jgi:O-antigen ligase
LELLHFNRYLLIIFPWALATGPFLPDLIVSLSGLVFLIGSLYRRYWEYYKHKLVWVFGLFYFYLLVRSLLAADIWLSLESSLFYFRYLFFVLAVWYCCDHHPQFIKYMAYSGLAALVLVSLDAYLQYFTGYNSLMMKQTHPLRVSGFFGDELILGSYLSRLIPVFFGLYLFIHPSLKVKHLLPLLVLLILVDVMVFIAGERSALFNLFLFTIGIIICITKFKLLRLMTFAISLMIMSALIYLNPVHQERMINQTIEQMGLEQDSQLQAFSPLHQAHFTTAYKMFQDNPIFGQGPNMFRKLCSQEQFNVPNACTTHPHQLYLELLGEGGLIAFLPVFAVLIYLISLFLRQIWSVWLSKKIHSPFLSDAQVCLYLALLITLWPLIPTGSFFTNNWIGGIYFLPIGFLLSKKLHNN